MHRIAAGRYKVRVVVCVFSFFWCLGGCVRIRLVLIVVVWVLGCMLDSMTHELWLRQAESGCPPDAELVAVEQYGLFVDWPHREAYLPVLGDFVDRVFGGVKSKALVCREFTRGGGKSVFAAFMRLYLAEYVIPFIRGARVANRRMIIFSRDEKHLHNDVMQGLVEMLMECSPWLKFRDWEARLAAGQNIEEAQLRSRKWTNSRLDLSNGVSIRGHTFRQNVRGYHVYYVDIDDLLTEDNAAFSGEMMDKIRGMILPAIEPGGLLLVLGTPQWPGDMYDLIRENEGWNYMAFPAYDVSGDLHYAKKNRASVERGEYKEEWFKCPEDWHTLWIRRLSWESLRQARGHTREDELKYQREYLLERVIDSTALVHVEDINHAKDETLSYTRSGETRHRYYAGLDPSSLKQDDAAFCVGVVDENDARVIQHFHNIRANPNLRDGEIRVIENLNAIDQQFNHPKWIVEGNGFQSVIQTLMRAIRPGINMDTFFLSASKHTENGWLGIRTAFRSGKVRLPYKTDEDKRITDEFIHQLRGLQVVDGKIIEDRRRKNDLVSAFFLFLKATEGVSNEYRVALKELTSALTPPKEKKLKPNPETSPREYYKRLPGAQGAFNRVQKAESMRRRRIGF